MQDVSCCAHGEAVVFLFSRLPGLCVWLLFGTEDAGTRGFGGRSRKWWDLYEDERRE